MRLRLLVLALGLLSWTAGPARAEGTACRSILERDCDEGVARVTTKGDLRVEVFTRKRSVSFPLASASAETREEFASSCPGGQCACDEDVQYFEFKGPVPGFRQVNALEHSAVAKTKCSIDNSNVMRRAGLFAVSAKFVSTAIYELAYCRTCGGSCHGSTVLATYDGRTGSALRIGDFLKPGAVDALRAQMAAHVVATYVDAADRERQRAKLLKELAARALVDEGFYVENGTVVVNLNSFVLSCADASFFPVPVPRELISPAFLGAL